MTRMNPDRTTALAGLRPLPSAGPWAHVSWDAIAPLIAQRVRDPDRIDQGQTSLCASAVVLHALASADPPRYVALAREVFSRGEVAGHPVSRALLQAAPDGTNPLDWMLLSALRDVARGWPAYRGRPTSSVREAFEGMAFPITVRRMLAILFPRVFAQSLSSFFGGALTRARQINRHLAQEPHAPVFLLIRASALERPRSVESCTLLQRLKRAVVDRIPDHWVQLLTPFTFRDGKVLFAIFTWGARRDCRLDRSVFEAMVYDTILIGNDSIGGASS